MREIFFRGKATDGGDWVYGSLHIEYGEMANSDTERSLDYRILGMCGDCCYVDPETIGQYTGLSDKNGKKIFEGDIIKFHKFRNEPKWTGEVKMDTQMWIAKGSHPIAFETGLCSIYKEEIEVIGNIHDNPELMGGGK